MRLHPLFQLYNLSVCGFSFFFLRFLQHICLRPATLSWYCLRRKNLSRRRWVPPFFVMSFNGFSSIVNDGSVLIHSFLFCRQRLSWRRAKLRSDDPGSTVPISFFIWIVLEEPVYSRDLVIPSLFSVWNEPTDISESWLCRTENIRFTL